MSSKLKMVKSVNGPGVQGENMDAGIRLGLRVHKLEREIAELHLPDDIKEMMEGALADRQLTFECKYRQVCRWIEMQKRGSFWQDFGCRSLDELWARLDLPGGSALATWEVLVRLFDRDTFLLVGDDELGYMCRLVATYQMDVELRKRDYQAIFDEYCKQYAAFDKDSFRRHVNWYINQCYVLPTLRVGAEKTIDKTKRPPRLVRKGDVQRREVALLPDSQSGKSVKDFITRKDVCAGCHELRDFGRAAVAYIDSLEDFIRQNVGPRFGPARPPSLSPAEILTLLDGDD